MAEQNAQKQERKKVFRGQVSKEQTVKAPIVAPVVEKKEAQITKKPETLNLNN
jgi:hypothetical protein